MVRIPYTNFKGFVENSIGKLDGHVIELLVKCIDNVFITDLSIDLSEIDALLLRSLVLEIYQGAYLDSEEVPYCLNFGEALEEIVN